MCYEEAIRYAKFRKTFGQKIWSSQVIRGKCAEMIRRIEGNFSWTESLCYQITQGIKGMFIFDFFLFSFFFPLGSHIAGQIAMLKVAATQTYEYCAREASQIFGGNSYLRSGPGELVERLYREVRVNAIGGGSEEIMDDLAMRRIRFKLKSKL
jgi:alkylation response protein AidB-like acyl-CoA dehydrogenase